MIERTGRVKIEAAVDTAAFTEFERHMGSFGDEIRNLTRNLTVAGVAVDALKESLRFAKDMMVSSLKAGLEWGDDIRGKEREIGALSTAVGGLADSLSLAAAREKLMGGVVDASEQQVRSAAKAAVEYSRKMNVDMRSALETVSDRLVGGRGLSKLMRELGIEFDETGNKVEDIHGALRILDDRFGDTTVTAQNQKEQIDQLSSAWKDLKGQIGDSILQTESVTKGINLTTVAMRGLTAELKEQHSWWEKLGLVGAMLDPSGAGAGTLAVRQMVRDASGGRERAGTAKGTGEIAQPFDPIKASRTGWKTSDITVGGFPINELPEWMTADGASRGSRQSGGYSPFGDVDQGSPFGDLVADTMAQAQAAKAFMDAELAAYDYAKALRKVSEEEADFRETVLDADKALQKQMADQVAANRIHGETNQDLKNLASGALQQFTAGLWSAADAALIGGKTAGEAVGELTKSVLLGLATQATWKALFALGEAALNWYNPYAVEESLRAFGFYTAVAVGAGAGGLGMSYAGVGASGGGAGASSSSGSAYRPSVGQDTTSKKETQNIIVKVTFDRSDPGAERWSRRQVRAEREAA